MAQSPHLVSPTSPEQFLQTVQCALCSPMGRESMTETSSPELGPWDPAIEDSSLRACSSLQNDLVLLSGDDGSSYSDPPLQQHERGHNMS